MQAARFPRPDGKKRGEEPSPTVFLRRLAAVDMLTDTKALEIVAENSTCPKTRAKAKEKLLLARLRQGPTSRS